MKIKRVRIENFCCLKNTEVSFDSTTSLIGPTGVGKSTVLRALDWFFNGEKDKALEEGDVHSASDTKRIRVEVEFDGLTALDREALGHYAPEGVDSVRVWRTWDDGVDTISGKALAYAPFEEVRQHEGKSAKNSAYKALRAEKVSLGLPAVRSWDDAEAAMIAWESANRDQLVESTVDRTQFFGFAGQGLLAKLIDFVFVSADLRGYEEADDGRTTVVGRILEHALDRSEADARFAVIEQDAQTARQLVHKEIYGPMLKELSGSLSDEVAKLTMGRHVVVSPVAQTPRPTKTAFAVNIKDGAALTSVRRQGHGFQRALLIAALKFLAESSRPEAGHRALCLAIEEPELFQHPAQTKVFARVLRSVVTSAPDRTQVMYATHSPALIDPSSYEQVRRLTRVNSGAHPEVRVQHLRENELVQSLAGRVSEKSIRQRANTRYVHDLAEAFFVTAAIVVEGPTERALILGFAERQGIDLGASGISVVNAEGKSNLMLCHAILSGLGVACHLVFDSDTGPKAMDTKKPEAISKAGAENLDIFNHLGVPAAARPATTSEATHTVFEDDLDAYLTDHWPAWVMRRRELVKESDGYFDGKHAPTYGEAARTASGEPQALHALLENVIAMARA